MEFALNGNDSVTLPPGTYYVTKFTLNGNSALDIAGAVRILCTGDATFNGNANVGTVRTPFDFRFFTSGTSLKVNGGVSVGGFFYAPNAQAIVAGGGRIVGGLFAKSAIINGNGRVTRQADLTPPVVSILAPADGSSPANLAEVPVLGRATDPDSPVDVTVNGAPVSLVSDGSFTTTLDMSGVDHRSRPSRRHGGHRALASVTSRRGRTDTRLPTTLDSLLAPELASCRHSHRRLGTIRRLGRRVRSAERGSTVTPAGGDAKLPVTFDASGRSWSVSASTSLVTAFTMTVTDGRGWKVREFSGHLGRRVDHRSALRRGEFLKRRG
jgi:hypothetical protein